MSANFWRLFGGGVSNENETALAQFVFSRLWCSRLPRPWRNRLRSKSLHCLTNSPAKAYANVTFQLPPWEPGTDQVKITSKRGLTSFR
jgi:hypothetical protein